MLFSLFMYDLSHLGRAVCDGGPSLPTFSSRPLKWKREPFP